MGCKRVPSGTITVARISNIPRAHYTICYIQTVLLVVGSEGSEATGQAWVLVGRVNGRSLVAKWAFRYSLWLPSSPLELLVSWRLVSEVTGSIPKRLIFIQRWIFGTTNYSARRTLGISIASDWIKTKIYNLKS